MIEPEPKLQLTLNAYRAIFDTDSNISLSVARRGRLALDAMLASVNWRISQSVLSQQRRHKPIELQDPIFIVGPWRSGTTVMHELLATATGYATPQTWQCMNAASSMLMGVPVRSHSKRRPMDDRLVDAGSPQEDEFALLTLGVPSAYRAFLIPHRIREFIDLLQPAFWMDNRRWSEIWTCFLLTTLAANPSRDHTLILKSPTHTYRIPAILRLFPRAKFIWMTRDPGELFISNRRMWHSMFTRYGFTRCIATDLDEFIIQALAAAARMMDWCVANIPASQFVAVPVSFLHSNPSLTLAHICARLNFEVKCNDDRLDVLAGSLREPIGIDRRDLPTIASNSLIMLAAAYDHGLMAGLSAHGRVAAASTSHP